VRLEGLVKWKQYIHLIASLSRDVPASGIVAQPLCYHCVQNVAGNFETCLEETHANVRTRANCVLQFTCASDISIFTLSYIEISIHFRYKYIFYFKITFVSLIQILA
jgi:hypothetical protein